MEILQWGETGLQKINLSECTNLRKTASPSKNSFINITSFESTFQGCISLIQIPQDLFENCPNVTSLSFAFWGCTGLTGETPTLWIKGTNMEENNYKGNPDGLACFWKCTGLSNYDIIPEYWKESGE